MRAIIATLTASTLAVVSPAAAQDEPGYPVKDFLGITAFTETAVSPGGDAVAFITRVNDFENDRREMAIWRLELDRDGSVRRQTRLTQVAGTYSTLRWSDDGRYLAFLSTRGEEKRPQVYVLDQRGGEAMRVTNPEAYEKGVGGLDWLPGGHELVFAAPISLTVEQKEAQLELYGDVVRYRIQEYRTGFWSVAVDDRGAGEADQLATVPMTVTELAASPDGMTIAFVSGGPTEPEVYYDGFGGREVYLLPADGGEVRKLTSNFVSEGNLVWRRDGRGLYATGLGYPDADRTRWTQGRLFRIGLDGTLERLAPAFEGELASSYGSGSVVLLRDGSLLSNGTASTRRNFYRIDPKSGEVRRLTDFTGSVGDLSASGDGRVIAFSLISDRSFPEIYVARGIDGLPQARRATGFNVDMAQRPMPEVETITWSNGEGDEIEGILYWPPGRRGERGLPLVVDIHGGPWSVRTESLGPIGSAYYPALLASRGYLVLEPNYRGGVGRGDEFLHAIEGYSCSRPSTDVLTGVDYLVERGLADPDRMGVMGYSYGGLLTNCIITRTDRFAAAISGAGLWNDISYFGTADNFTQNDVRNLGAAPWEDLEGYWRESPISGAGNITTPTLVTIGGADRRVPTTQGHELYRALVRLGVPAEMLVFPGEGHGFTKPSHMLTKVRAEIRWLDRYLLGVEETATH